MVDREKVLKSLECCVVGAECDHCKYGMLNKNDFEGCRQMLADALALLKEYDRVLHLAKLMHTWIFLNTFDEQAVYDELGFTDEDNALLGSIGRPIVINGSDNDGREEGNQRR